MFYIQNRADAKKALTPDQHLEFIKKCETYIGLLKSESRLIAAQPIESEGIIIKKSGNGWIERNIASDLQTQVGYYHILANNLDEAIKIAKDNPEFEFVPSASIEIRQIKTKEDETGFVYPIKK